MTATTPSGRLGFIIGQQRVQFSEYVAQWRHAESVGMEVGYAFDHFVDETSRGLTNWLDAYATLAALAATTQRVRLGVLVSGACLRHPAHVAKVAATIDHISQGRFELGLGAGGSAADHEYLGIRLPSFAYRLGALEESLALTRKLFDESNVNFIGAHFATRESTLEPRPAQEQIPIWVGGEHPALVELAGRAADGWNCYQMPMDNYRNRVVRLRSAEAAAGRRAGAVRQSVVVKVVHAATRSAVDDAVGAIAARANMARHEVASSIVAGRPDDWVDQLRPWADLGVRELLFDLEADEPSINADLLEHVTGVFGPKFSEATRIRWGGPYR